MSGGIIDGGGSGQPIVWLLGNNTTTLFSGVKFYSENSYPPSYIFQNSGSVDRFICMGSFRDISSIPSIPAWNGAAATNANFNMGMGVCVFTCGIV